MSDKNDRMPDEISAGSRSGDNAVRLKFHYDGAADISVDLDQPRLLQLIALLTGKIEHGPLSPISLSRLKPGAVIQQESVLFQSAPNGVVQATFGVQLEGRFVTLAFNLSEQDLANLDRER